MSRKEARAEIRHQGIGVSPGIVRGEASLLEDGDLQVPRYRIAPYDVEEEVARFQRALEKTRAELGGTRERLARDIGEEHLYILDCHLMMLQDDMLVGVTVEGIRRDRWNAEGALEDTLERFQALFSRADDEYLRDRRNDIRQVVRYVQRKLMGVSPPRTPQKGSPVILVAHELTAADLLRLNRGHVLGFITEIGGRTSHNAIIADALGIPGVLGLPGATSLIRQGDFVVLDGGTGLVTVHPTEGTLEEAERLRRTYDDRRRALRRLRDLPCETLDGVRVTLRANIGSPEELTAVQEHRAQGVGLYRTEYLFLNRDDLPTEEEHLDVYRRVAAAVTPEPAVFRTFDLGGDVAARTLGTPREANPVLGLRAIRLALAREDVLRTQVRALLRASADGRIRILHPFISGLEEVRKVRAVMEEAAAELAGEGAATSRLPAMGVMVETPSAAILADVLAREVDFFTVGTNDLVQYTLAADRGNERVAHLYDPLHPAVLRLLRGIVRAGLEAGIDVSVCGEMAGDPASAVLLVGMGVRELSMSPQRVPQVKEALRGVSSVQAEAWAKEALTFSTAEEIHAWAETHLHFEGPAGPPSQAQLAAGRAS
ncbi:MAG: phosphoenolpyruvate--protein phosphotransferase [Nitrospinota bacterium]